MTHSTPLQQAVKFIESKVMENVEGCAEKEEYQSCLGQERRLYFCIGTHFAEIFEFTSVCVPNPHHP